MYWIHLPKLIHQQVEGLRLLSDQIVEMIESESIDIKEKKVIDISTEEKI